MVLGVGGRNERLEEGSVEGGVAFSKLKVVAY